MSKGDRPRPVDKKKYDKNYDSIDWGRKDRRLNDGFNKQQKNAKLRGMSAKKVHRDRKAL